MNWLDFGRDPPKVKGQWTWSKYAIFTSLMRNLKKPWVDFHQTWYRGAPPGVDELIRFLGEIRPTLKVKGQLTWSKYAIFTSLTTEI